MSEPQFPTVRAQDVTAPCPHGAGYGYCPICDGGKRSMTTVRTSFPISYSYRVREGDRLHILRRPQTGFTDHEWVIHLLNHRDGLFKLHNHQPPSYENLTCYGQSIRKPGKWESRAFEIASILGSLFRGTDKPGHEPYVAS